LAKAAESGWVGQLAADGSSNQAGKVGDKGFFNTDTYRTILSFDTSGVPAGSSVTGASLRIFGKSQSGALSSVSFDIKKGTFGPSQELQRAAYNAAASASNIASISSVPVGNNYVDILLPSSALTYIQIGGSSSTTRTQFRLAASTVASFAANVWDLWAGQEQQQQPQYIPTLTITYH